MAGNSIYLQVTFGTDDAQKQIDALNKQIQAIGTTSAGASKVATQSMNSVTLSVEQLTDSADKLGAAFAGLGVARGFKELLGMGVEMQRLRESFAAIPEGNELLKQIDDMAKRTGTFVTDMRQAAVVLKNAGVPVRDLSRDLEIMANQLAAAGKAPGSIVELSNALAKIEVAAHPSIRQLQTIFQQSGFPISQKVAEALHESLLKVASDLQQFKPDQFRQFVIQLMSAENAGRAAARTTTDLGAGMNNLKTSTAELGEALEQALGPSLIRVINYMKQVVELFAGWTDTFGKLPDEVKDFAVVVGGLAAAFVALGFAVKSVTIAADALGATSVFKALWAMRGAAGGLTTLGIAGGPIAAEAAGAAGGAAAGAGIGTAIGGGAASGSLAGPIGVAVGAIIAAIGYGIYKYLQGPAPPSAPKAPGVPEGALPIVPPEIEMKPEAIEKAITKSQNVLDQARAASLKAGKESIAALGPIYDEYFRDAKGVEDAIANYRKALASQIDAEINKIHEAAMDRHRKMALEIFREEARLEVDAAQIVPDETLPAKLALEKKKYEAHVAELQKESEFEADEIKRRYAKQIDAAHEQLARTELEEIQKAQRITKLEESERSELDDNQRKAEVKAQSDRYQYYRHANELILADWEKTQQQMLEISLSAIQHQADATRALIQTQRPANLKEQLQQIQAVFATDTKAILDARDRQLSASADQLVQYIRAHPENEEGMRKAVEDARQRDAKLQADATAEAFQAEVRAWKEKDQAILENQKEFYDNLKSLMSGFWDAVLDKSHSVWQNIGQFMERTILGFVKDVMSSRLAASFTEAFGKGSVTFPDREHPTRAYFPTRLAPLALPGGIESQQSNIQYATDLMTAAGDLKTVSSTLLIGGQGLIQASDELKDAASQLKVGGGAADVARVETSGEAHRAMDEGTGEAFSAASAATGVPQVLLKSVAQVESAFNPRAIGPLTRSGERAMGLMQLMPGTARAMGVTDVLDPRQNAMGGARYLQQLLTKYNGDVDLALKAYNWGPANVDNALQRGGAIPSSVQSYSNQIQRLMGASVEQTLAAGTPDLLPPPPILAPNIGFPITAMTAQAYPAMAPPVLAPMGMMPAISATTIPSTGLPFPATAGAYGIPAPMRAAPAGVATPSLGPLGFANFAKGFGIGSPMFVEGQGVVPWGVLSPTEKLGIIAHSPAMAGLLTMTGASMAMGGLQRGGVLGNVQTTIGGAMTGAGLASMFGAGIGAGVSMTAGGLLGAGVGLAAAGLQRGGKIGFGMSVGGGALAGAVIGNVIFPGLGALAGAAIGAGVGAIAGGIRMIFPSLDQRIRDMVKSTYGIDIRQKSVRDQIAQITNSQYGGTLSLAIFSPEVQNIVRLYSLSQGINVAGRLPRPEYPATFAQSGAGGLQLQPVYSGGQMISSPYVGVTTSQYSMVQSELQGARNAPGANPLYLQLSPAQALALFSGQVTQVIGNNPAVVANANTVGAQMGTSRMAQASSLMEPLTAVR